MQKDAVVGPGGMVKIKVFDTPCYVYDTGQIEKNIRTLLQKFSDFAEIFFAVKANTALALLKLIKRKNIGAEVVSPGEVYICLKSGFNPEKILYNNIARKKDAVLYAIKRGVVFYNFEGIDQALLLEQCAKELKKEIKMFVRINPGLFPKTHPHLSTGSSWSKFGIEMTELNKVTDVVRKFKYSKLVGIHSHIGSQILSPLPFVKATRKAGETLEFFENRGIKIDYVNLGGGFGVPYRPSEKSINFQPIVRSYKSFAEKYGVKIFLEPGRFLVANAGYILTRLLSIKKRNGIPLYIIDAGMTENPRPALYDAYHHIASVSNKNRKRRLSRVTGPLCENSDEFGIYKLSKLQIGDLLLIHNCGAYTRTMASNYNGRLLPAEYIIDGNNVRLIRKQQKYESLVENERY